MKCSVLHEDVKEDTKEERKMLIEGLTGSIASVAEVSSEGVWLVIALPLWAAAIVVVGENLVVMDVATGEKRTATWTTHRRRSVRVSHFSSFVANALQGTRHKIERA